MTYSNIHISFRACSGFVFVARAAQRINPQHALTTLLIIMIATLSHVNIASAQIGADDKFIMFQTNLLVEPADSLLARVDRAQAKGANAVLLLDSKITRFGAGNYPGNQWKNQADQFVAGVKARGMKLVFRTVTTGFNGAMLSTNPNLTTGYPIINQEVQIVNNDLVPVSSAYISNGGFENYQGNSPTDWGFQDDPGLRTFIDTNVKRSGNASFRIEPRNGNQARIFRNFPVKPYHHYTLVAWVKMENLTADLVYPLLRDNNNTDRALSALKMSIENPDGGRQYINSVQNYDLDWTEVRIAFNSLDATSVNLGLTTFGGTAGAIWWDDVEIVDSPFLNWLNRNDLPVNITKNGQALVLGQDVETPTDPLLGQVPYSGSYDTHHAPPIVNVLDNTNLFEGDILEVSGYHALLTGNNGQVSGAWNNPDWLATARLVHQTLYNEFEPDGFLLDYSEIRAGGWEPTDLAYGTSGQALAASIQQAVSDIDLVAPQAQIYFWSDMVDPNHNAIPLYYQVNNTLDQSWVTLDPAKVTVITWWEGPYITNKGPLSLSHFANLGFNQIVGGFYDEDVTDNFNRWTTAAAGISNIKGSLYASWVQDYSKIEDFGELWWQSSALDLLVSVDGPDEVVPGESYDVTVEYSAAEARDLQIILQLAQPPWTDYGFEIITVPAGPSVLTFNFSVDPAMPIATDIYKWSSVLTTIGGDWYTRFDDINQYGVDAIEGRTELSLRLMLEGPYDSGSGLMNDALREKNLLPVSNPWGQGPDITNDAYSVTGNDALVDWIQIELRDVNDFSTVLYATSGLIQRDGDVVSSDGVSLVELDAVLPASFYVVVRHQSHLLAMSANPVSLINAMATYDFTTQNSYTTSSAGQRELVPGVWGLFGGNGSGNGDINGQDNALWVTENGLFSIYSSKDFNMDADINGADKSLWRMNNGLFSEIP